MRALPITPLLLGFLVPGCSGPSKAPRDADPGDSGPASNPKVLWLASDMTETRVKLVESEPPPF